MSKLRFRISLSLDGFVAGPKQSLENPLGIGGEGLHAWAIELAAWRAAHGRAGGEVNESTPVMAASLQNIGATIMGRNMFGGHPGPWRDWKGWWGSNPPFHHPVFVVTHHPRAPLELEGGNRFTFVTEGIEAALEQARRAAGGKDVALAGGASVARQFLQAGHVDEMELSMVPILLGAGERLFEGLGDDLHGLCHVRTVAAPDVNHLKFIRSGTEVVSDREVVTIRSFDAPRERVFDAWTDSKTLASWWGPKGFTNTFHEHEVKPGGKWRFTMRGPDGAEFKNHSVYEQITRPERIVFNHVTGPNYRASCDLSERGGRTIVKWRMRFDNPAVFANIRELVAAGNEDNMDKLAAVLA